MTFPSTLWLLLGITSIHIMMLYLFISGFFLTKHDLLTSSTCNSLPIPSFINSTQSKILIDYLSPKKGCWTSPQYSKLIILLIDALKFDFAVPSFMQKSSYASINYYEHKLTSIERLLSNDHQHSHLFKFISNPPTITSQRIKALTTGTFPTFFDSASAFSSTMIATDNLLKQWNIRHNIAFMGDDTWNNAFSSTYFRYNYPYPSFDVYDLNTVDNGCKQHLFPLLYNNTNEWQILIAHFLGVDHVGHRYHMNHPQMSVKLSEMNEVIENVTQWMTEYKVQYPMEDVLLVVFGDHGMLESGDHGGSTDDEINAALFVHSTKRFLISNGDSIQSVPQINIVPTLSLLMGVPIPFCNIGGIIPEIYLSINSAHVSNEYYEQMYENLMKAMIINSMQVYQYIERYSIEFGSGTFTLREIDEMRVQLNEIIEEIFNKIGHQSDMKNIVSKLKMFLKNAYELCAEKWTSFNLLKMRIGSCIACFCILLILYLLRFEIQNKNICVMMCMYFQGLFTDTYIRYEPQLLLFLLILSLFFMLLNNVQQWKWLFIIAICLRLMVPPENTIDHDS